VKLVKIIFVISSNVFNEMLDAT